jgi:hypothetical protein
MTKKLWRNKNVLIVLLTLSMIITMLWQTRPILGQTPVKSSAEQRLRRIEEHQQVRQAALELTQDLRAIHLTPEQRQEIRQVLKRYHTNAGTGRATQSAPQPTVEGSGPAAPAQAAERLRTDVAAVLTSEQNDRLNTVKQEREERAQRNPDFQIRKKP